MKEWSDIRKACPFCLDTVDRFPNQEKYSCRSCDWEGDYFISLEERTLVKDNVTAENLAPTIAGYNCLEENGIKWFAIQQPNGTYETYVFTESPSDGSIPAKGMRTLVKGNG